MPPTTSLPLSCWYPRQRDVEDLAPRPLGADADDGGGGDGGDEDDDADDEPHEHTKHAAHG